MPALHARASCAWRRPRRTGKRVEQAVLHHGAWRAGVALLRPAGRSARPCRRSCARLGQVAGRAHQHAPCGRHGRSRASGPALVELAGRRRCPRVMGRASMSARRPIMRPLSVQRLPRITPTTPVLPMPSMDLVDAAGHRSAPPRWRRCGLPRSPVQDARAGPRATRSVRHGTSGWILEPCARTYVIANYRN